MPRPVVLRADRRVGERRDVRRVDLHVGAAEAHQLSDLLLEDVRRIGEGIERIGVGLRRALRVPPLAQHERARERRLRRLIGASAKVGELLGGDRADAPQLRAHRMLRDRARQVLRAVRLVAAPGRRRWRRPVDALDRVDETSREDEPPSLAVAENVEAAIALQGDRIVDGAILDALVVVPRELPALERLPSVHQVRGTQEGPDVLGAIRHRSTVSQSRRASNRAVPATGTGGCIFAAQRHTIDRRRREGTDGGWARPAGS